VGGYAVQLAARAGAIVTATASPASRDRVQSYGANRVIDHTATPVWEAVAGERFDVVLNLVYFSDQEDLVRLADLVVDGGAFANTVPPGLQGTERGVRNFQVFGHSDADQLAGLVSRVDAGELKIHVAQRRPLAELRAVHEQAAAGELAGKTVLVP
jgi:NADPH:quinone reductase-like Zn-dependent oxidoreductase